MNELELLAWLKENITEWPHNSEQANKLPDLPYLTWFNAYSQGIVAMYKPKDSSQAIGVKKNNWEQHKAMYESPKIEPCSDSESVFIDPPQITFNKEAQEFECAYDPVKKPSHYEVMEGVESIDIIASSLTLEGWKGFCLGNIIKYRLRAGKKDALQQDVDKANQYEILYESKKHLCKVI